MTRRLELQPALEAEEEPNRTLSEIMMHLKCVRQLRFPQASLLNKSFSFHWFGVAVCPERLLNGSAWGRLEGLRVPLGEKFRGGFSEAASAVGNQVLILPGQSLTVHVFGHHSHGSSGPPFRAFSFFTGRMEIRSEERRTEVGHPRRHPEIRRVRKSQEQATRGFRPPGGDVKGV